MHYFYSKNCGHSEIILSKEEAHHASRVLRLNNGDQVGVFDGEGIIYHCHIIELTKNGCTLAIDEKIISKRQRPNLSIAIAPTKSNERFEWFLEKATEIGIGEIIPILTEHSERKNIRIDRFEKVLISAMKQSMNPFLPRLREMITFNEVIHSFENEDRFISHCEKTNKKDLFDLLSIKNPSIVLIGPEGDFSTAEIKNAIQLGWIEVSLGEQRFRTETAGIIATHLHSLKTKDQ